MELSESQEDARMIGEVAEVCGVSRDTLRYWEDRGLIPEPPRDNSSGYRLYPPDLVRRIHAIVRAKDLGFTLDEIKRLFEGRDRGETCDTLADLAREHIEACQHKIAQLERNIEGLRRLAEICPEELPATECPVIDMLADR